MEIQLNWTDPAKVESQEAVYQLPVAIGREGERIPNNYQGQQLSKAVFNNQEISGFHALIILENGQLIIEDKSTNGMTVNEELLHQASQPLSSGDILKIGPYTITFTLLPEFLGTQVSNRFPVNRININEPQEAAESANLPSTIIFDPETDEINVQASPTAYATTSINSFPPPAFMEPKQVSVQAIHATGDQVDETDYLALGGGIGSFAWVDTIRIYGVKANRIAVVGLEKKPYGRYQRLCRNSQIPPHERLRSGSDSCPDNIWGWPGYAWREAWKDMFSGQVASAAKKLWQVFAEPALANTYTPKSGNVFDSVDREAERIGWKQMLKYGRIRGIRKTEDGRYCVAYSVPGETRQEHRYIMARYVHIAIGYPAIRFLPDLQEYRDTYKDYQSVVNAYEPHAEIYQKLESKGGIAIVRGRGIVASRIIQRLYEAHKKNPNVRIIHLVRTPTPEGKKFGPAQRFVENHWEFQPYNWPKGTWGGDMRSMLEAASPEQRYDILKALGGTTTADRKDWRAIIAKGLKEGWYTITFGEVERVERDRMGKPLTYLKTKQGEIKVEADFIIDSTGLEASPKNNLLINDLITHYGLPLAPYGGLNVANDFELVQMRNDRARMYAAGVLTLGGPYAPVDTFLGLQYAAQRSADGLVRARAPGMRYLDGIGSLWQWTKWASNQEP